MLGGGMIMILWKEIYADLNVFGKVLFFSFCIVGSLCMTLLGIIEFISVDVFVFLLLACSKTMSMRDFIDFCFGW